MFRVCFVFIVFALENHEVIGGRNGKPQGVFLFVLLFFFEDVGLNNTIPCQAITV